MVIHTGDRRLWVSSIIRSHASPLLTFAHGPEYHKVSKSITRRALPGGWFSRAILPICAERVPGERLFAAISLIHRENGIALAPDHPAASKRHKFWHS